MYQLLEHLHTSSCIVVNISEEVAIEDELVSRLLYGEVLII